MKKSVSCPTSPRSGNLKRCYSDSKLYDKNEIYSIINNNIIKDNNNCYDNSQSEDVILPIENISNQINIPKTINDNNDNDNSKNGSFLSSDILEESMFL